uniref:Leucine rich immune protein (Coil-less) n=1 Tax=Anopheles epiroticus TaxID=199890 RepID=A0A182P5X4_9DIPT
MALKCCKLTPQICTLDSWNPYEEGYFVLDHLPPKQHMLRISNILVSSIEGEFLTEASRKLRGLIIEKSSALKYLFVTKNSTIEFITINDSQLNRMQFDRNDAVRSIYIQKSSLKEIPATVNNLKRLESLTIHEAYITVVNFNYFFGLASFKRLEVEVNSVSSLTGLFLLSNKTVLNTIKFRHNLLATFDFDQLKAYDQLEKLDISSNVLKSVAGNLTNSNLRNLFLGNNFLSVLDCCVWNEIGTLRALDIKHNQFRSVPSCLTIFPNVLLINLSFNRIEHVRMQDFKGLNKLHELNLAGNKITCFEFGNDITLPSLIHLQLQKTCLCHVNGSEEAQQRMPQLNIYFYNIIGELCNVC